MLWKVPESFRMFWNVPFVPESFGISWKVPKIARMLWKISEGTVRRLLIEFREGAAEAARIVIHIENVVTIE